MVFYRGEDKVGEGRVKGIYTCLGGGLELGVLIFIEGGIERVIL